MNKSRIPDFSEKTQEGMSAWFSEMSKRDLLFHPEDRSVDIINIRTGEPVFTPYECVKLDGIMSEMFGRFGDGVCDEAYPVFMGAAGFPAGG